MRAVQIALILKSVVKNTNIHYENNNQNNQYFTAKSTATMTLTNHFLSVKEHANTNHFVLGPVS